jgi:hypothetical protein
MTAAEDWMMDKARAFSEMDMRVSGGNPNSGKDGSLEEGWQAGCRR